MIKFKAEQIKPSMITLVYMLLAGSLLSWWYGLGWAKLMQKVSGRVRGALDFFSVGQLASSLFVPYRQISAGSVRGSVGDQLRALGDRLFSRVFGAVIRLIIIFAGLLTVLIIGVIGLILIAAWPILPMLPIICVFLVQWGN